MRWAIAITREDETIEDLIHTVHEVAAPRREVRSFRWKRMESSNEVFRRSGRWWQIHSGLYSMLGLGRFARADRFFKCYARGSAMRPPLSGSRTPVVPGYVSGSPLRVRTAR